MYRIQLSDASALRNGESENKVNLPLTKPLATTNFSSSALTRPSISKYSRTAPYNPPKLASLQKSSGTSKTLLTRLTSLLSLKSFPVSFRAEWRRRESVPVEASWRGMEVVCGSERVLWVSDSKCARRVDWASA